MCQSLRELAQEIESKKGKLHLFYGETAQVMQSIITHFWSMDYQVEAVAWNRDYTKFACERDTELRELFNNQGISVIEEHDCCLLGSQIETFRAKTSGNVYQKFTPFFKQATKVIQVPQPNSEDFSSAHWYIDSIEAGQSWNSVHLSSTNDEPPSKRTKIDCSTPNDQISRIEEETKCTQIEQAHVKGGRSEALEILSNLKSQKNYKEDSNLPNKQTTGLAAHNKFGTVSIRHVYHEIKKQLGVNHELIRQLWWRDFYYMVAYNFPHIFEGKSFKEKYDTVPWNNDEQKLENWKTGNTGFPIIDAGMRQLNQSGYMHNRVRMIVGSFLTKQLSIDWRLGEEYFAQHLSDYDMCQNNGNWQWVASTGCDSQPYFRIFNPWRQQQQFDPDAKYIKKWVPELKTVPAKDIHSWDKCFKNWLKKVSYPSPMIDNQSAASAAKDRYAKAVK